MLIVLSAIMIFPILDRFEIFSIAEMIEDMAKESIGMGDLPF